MTKRLSKAERERIDEEERREADRQVRVLRIPPWWFPLFVPIYTRGRTNGFQRGTEEHARWERMAQIQRRIDARRARCAAAKQANPEERK
jgi:hypothetical protein